MTDPKYTRKKKKNKQMRTNKIFGKNTSKGLRIKIQKIENQKNKKLK
jgi:hypothetical protein